MTPNLRVGRIAGIEIGLNWSWLVVVALIVWTLARGPVVQGLSGAPLASLSEYEGEPRTGRGSPSRI